MASVILIVFREMRSRYPRFFILYYLDVFIVSMYYFYNGKNVKGHIISRKLFAKEPTQISALATPLLLWRC